LRKVRASGGQLLDPYSLLDEDGHLIVDYQEAFDENDYQNPNEDIAKMALQYGTASNMEVGRQEASSDSPSTVLPFRSPQQAHESYMLLKAFLSGNH
jgi:hypothetical protein